jgi:hypothetical protein
MWGRGVSRGGDGRGRGTGGVRGRSRRRRLWRGWGVDRRGGRVVAGQREAQDLARGESRVAGVGEVGGEARESVEGEEPRGEEALAKKGGGGAGGREGVGAGRGGGQDSRSVAWQGGCIHHERPLDSRHERARRACRRGPRGASAGTGEKVPVGRGKARGNACTLPRQRTGGDFECRLRRRGVAGQGAERGLTGGCVLGAVPPARCRRAQAGRLCHHHHHHQPPGGVMRRAQAGRLCHHHHHHQAGTCRKHRRDACATTTTTTTIRQGHAGSTGGTPVPPPPPPQLPPPGRILKGVRTGCLCQRPPRRAHDGIGW